MNPVETGFYYLQSRYYDPNVGRFINADEPKMMAINNDDSIHANLFAYAYNNSVMNVDPTGYWGIKWLPTNVKLTIILGSALVGAIAAELKELNNPHHTLRSTIIAFAGGFLGGALLGLMAVFPKSYITAICGALTAIISYAVFCVINKKRIKIKDLVKAGITGFAVGGIYGLNGKKAKPEDFIKAAYSGAVSGLITRLWF